MTERFPKVPTRVRRSLNRRDQRWILELTCPHCGKDHVHGGGPADYPPLLGVRLSHCVNHARDYDLVPDEDINAIAVVTADRRPA